MKQGIHPAVELTTITCACGAVHEVMTTKKGLRVEICSNCHPFYTGDRKRTVDSGGRVEKFLRKYGRRENA